VPTYDDQGQTPDERAAQAVHLRMMGLTYTQIADQLGYASRGAAFNAVTAELDRQAVDGAESRQATVAVMLVRLDRLLRGLWADASAGDPAAVDRVLAIEKRRAELLTMATPEAQPQTEEAGVSSISAARAARQARAAAQQPSSPPS
jgi:hypothetical protein